MPSQKKIQANRSNAMKRTRPKTPQGKARVSENAVTHGLSSQKAVLRGEDGAEYERLRVDVFAHRKPVGAAEERMAVQMVSFLWQLARLDRFASALFDHLVKRAAGRRVFDIESKGLMIGETLHMFEK